MPHPLIEEILTSAGLPLPAGRGEGHITLAGAHYFAKTSAHGSRPGSGFSPAQVRAEAASLAAMARGAAAAPASTREHASLPLLLPSIIGYRERDGVAALVTSYAAGRGSGRGDMRALGLGLARIHHPPHPGTQRAEDGIAAKEGPAVSPSDGNSTSAPPTTYNGAFGFPVPTFCGATDQDNTWEASWEVFFRDRRLGDLVRRIGDGRVSRLWGQMVAPSGPTALLLGGITPPPVPVPLHGDLWPGNVASAAAGPVIFDPAGYYGHGEADLGMTRMFGGFSREFYDAYHSVHPRSEPYHDQRIRLYELYHHLNHALMFGGSYTSSALGIMRELVDWAKTVPMAQAQSEG